MPAYLVATGTVKNPEAYQEYRTLAAAAIAQYDGRFIARGGTSEVLEGSFPGSRVVIVEFPELRSREGILQLARVPGSAPEAAGGRRPQLDHRRGRLDGRLRAYVNAGDAEREVRGSARRRTRRAP